MEKRETNKISVCLNLGSGQDYKQGWINLDIDKKVHPNIVWDMEKFPYPFPDNYFEFVYCSYALYHIKKHVEVLKEVSRILKPNGILHARVPHLSNAPARGEVTYKKDFGWVTFKNLINNYDLDFEIIFQKFNFLSNKYKKINYCVNWIFNLSQKFYERFFCWIIPVAEIEIKLKKVGKRDFYYVDKHEETKIKKWN